MRCYSPRRAGCGAIAGKSDLRCVSSEQAENRPKRHRPSGSAKKGLPASLLVRTYRSGYTHSKPTVCLQLMRRCTNLSISRHTKPPLSIIFLSLLVVLFGCTLSDGVDNRNFAVDIYSPTPNEIQLAQRRAQHYWQKNSQKFKNPTRYLAVPATSVLQGDVVQNLYPKLISSETTASYFSQSEDSVLNATCIMIYDAVTNRFVTDSGYISVELPPRGSVARWESYMARYTGW